MQKDRKCEIRNHDLILYLLKSYFTIKWVISFIQDEKQRNKIGVGQYAHKISKLPHHRHLKFIMHHLKKNLTQGSVSITENNVININLK